MTVNELHDKAMVLMQEWQIYTFLPFHESPINQLKEAMECESRAARMVPVGKENEPSRSILFRSAASIAILAGDIKEAKKLIKEGISGFTPDEIEREFRDLEEKIKEKL